MALSGDRLWEWLEEKQEIIHKIHDELKHIDEEDLTKAETNILRHLKKSFEQDDKWEEKKG